MNNIPNTQVILLNTPQQTQTSTGLSDTQTSPLSNKPSPELTNTPLTQQTDFTIIPNGQVFQGKVLGSGGFGIIYAGSWKTFQVAIKILRAKDDRLQEEFLNESKIMARLKHSRIVRFFGIGKNPLMMVMELLPRGDLSNLLSNPKQQLPWEPNRWRWVLDIGAGVAYLHSQNIFHRDLKSQNVLLDASLRAKIADFGLSLRKTTSDLILDRQAGSIPWMAPELFSKQVKLTAASDVYAYGMTLWEIASRKFPFADALNQDIIPNWIQEGEREEIPANCPKPIADIIQACWAQDPTKRPSSLEILTSLKKAKPESVPDLPETESDAFSKIIEILRVLVTFIGRKDHLTALKKNLADDWQPKGFTRIQVITGLGGVGKSELACQFANQSIPQFDLIYWIPSETQFQRENAFRDLAAKLGVYLDKEDKYPTIRKKVYRNLEERSFQKPYLLIFDNLEEKEVFPFGNGSILITAQNSQPYHPQQVLTVKSFTEAEAIEFVQTTTKETDLKSIKSLVNILGNFPLAIDKACAYINKEKTTVSKYLEKLDVKSLLKESGTERHKLSLLATWQLTLKVLDPLAVEWLTLCAYLAPNNIPASWITTWLKQQKKDTTNGDSILRSLRNYGLIDYSHQGGPFSIHRLLQQILRTPEAEKYYHQALSLAAEAGEQFDANNTESWEIGQLFLSHTKILLTHKVSKNIDQKTLANLFEQAGMVELHLANYTSSLAYFKQSLAIKKELYGKDDESISPTLNNVGGTLLRLGQLDEALLFFKQSIALDKKESASTSSTLNNIGLALKEKQNFDEALIYYRQALANLKKIDGQDNLIATVLNNIGTALKSQKDLVGAIHHYKQAVSIWEKLYGDEHPSVVTGLNNIGSALNSQEKADEAFVYLKPALSMCKKILGNKHPLAAQILNNFASALQINKKYDEALVLQKQCLEISTKVYGENNPYLGLVLSNMGNALSHLEKTDEALKCYKQALVIWRTAYGDHDPRVAQVRQEIMNLLEGQGKIQETLVYLRQTLGSREDGKKQRDDVTLLNQVSAILYKQGKSSQALTYQKHALKIAKHVHGDQHPLVFVSLNNIAEMSKTEGKSDQALSYYKQALEAAKKTGNDNDPLILMSLKNIADLLLRMKKSDKALVYLQRILNIQEKKHGKDHPMLLDLVTRIMNILDLQGKVKEATSYLKQALEIKSKMRGETKSEVAKILNHIGMSAQSQGDTEKALIYFYEALTIARKTHGNQHEIVAAILNNIGTALINQQKFDQAIVCLKEALDISEKVHGKEDLSIAAALNNIGIILKKSGHLKEALIYLKRGLVMTKKLMGDQHPQVTRGLNNIGTTLDKLGNYTESIAYHKQSLALRQKVFGNDHPDVATSLNNLGNALEHNQNVNDALNYYQRALTIYKKTYGNYHPDVAMSLKNIAEALNSLQKYQEALTYFKQMLVTCKKLYGIGHSVVLYVSQMITTIENKLKNPKPKAPPPEKLKNTSRDSRSGCSVQ